MKDGTEDNNPRSFNIDSFSTLDIVKTIHIEDIRAYEAVGCALPEMAEVIDLIYERFSRGGRIIYAGAGTSGRMGVVDAVEMWPTYGMGKDKFDFIIAGGIKALTEAQEGAEDLKEEAKTFLKEKGLSEEDILIGISSSGRTPFVIGAVEYGNNIGSLTVAIVNNSNTQLEKIAKKTIVLNTGSEVIQGSTRMKAGTALKMTLNIISTSIAIKSGRTYGNMMFHMKSYYNEKLKERAINMMMKRFRIDREKAIEILQKNDFDIERSADDLSKHQEM